MAAPLVLVVLVAVTVRAALYRSSLAAFIAERVEVASPLNAWKRGEGRAGPRSLSALVLWPLRLVRVSEPGGCNGIASGGGVRVQGR